MKSGIIIKSLLALAVAAALGFGAARAEDNDTPDPALLAKARVSQAGAQKTALTKAPNGTVKEVGLEMEKGRLIWSFGFTTPGTKNITEVNVDAITGAIVNVETEKPKAKGEKDDDDDDKD